MHRDCLYDLFIRTILSFLLMLSFIEGEKTSGAAMTTGLVHATTYPPDRLRIAWCRRAVVLREAVKN